MEETGNQTEKKKLGKKQIIIIAAAAAVVVIAAIIIIVAVTRNNKLTATTMRINRIEGTVSLEQNGRVTAVKEDLRLKNGNALITEAASLVGIALDDYKFITLDELSRAEFIQKGKALELNLTEGSLFFEVKKPLESDETCEIHTSSMVVGIRGTSGWVRNTKDAEEVVITDGHVKIFILNPYTGETKEVEASGGQRVRVTFSQTMDGGTSINVTVEDIPESELDQFVIDRLQENDELRAKVVAETPWSDPVIMGEKDAAAEDKDDDKPADADDDDDKTGTDSDDDADDGDDNDDETEGQWRELAPLVVQPEAAGDVTPTAENPVVYVEWFPPATEEPVAQTPEPTTPTDPGTTDPGAGSNSGSSSGGSAGSTTGTINADGTATLSNGATASYDYEMLRITSGGTGVISLPIIMPDPDGGPNNLEIGLDGIALEDGVGGVNINANGLTDASAVNMMQKISNHPNCSITKTGVATVTTDADGKTTTNVVVNGDNSSNLQDFYGVSMEHQHPVDTVTYGSNVTIRRQDDAAAQGSTSYFSGTYTTPEGVTTSISNAAIISSPTLSSDQLYIDCSNDGGITHLIVHSDGTVTSFQ